MKRISKYVIAILLLISGCQSLYNLTMRQTIDFYYIHFFNSMFIDEVAKYVTCYYNHENKFPEGYFDIVPFLSNSSINKNTESDSTFLIRDNSFNGIARYEFKIKNLNIRTSILDSIDSYFDSVKVYECNGTLTYIDSLYQKDEKAFIINILITDINGSLYWNGDSSSYDKYNSSQILNSSPDNYSIIKDTIQIGKSCQKDYGLEINSKQQ